MIARAPRPCRKAGCRQLCRDGSGYCEDHKQIAKQWSTHGQSAHSRGYGASWRKLRARVLTRDKHLCQPCLKVGMLTPATAVDHIINKASGGTDRPDNLQSICASCHHAKSQREASEGMGGRKVQGHPA